MIERLLRSVAASVLALGLMSCASKPPLPKYASVEAAARSSSTENFAALVPEADVIYFPVDRASHGGRSDPAAQLLTALEQTGVPIAIAWHIIDASQQPLLDRLQTTEGAARENLIGQLNLEGTGRAREFCRSVLRASQGPAVRHLAIAPPSATMDKVRSGEPLSGEEQAQVPRGFRVPSGEFDAFTERLRTRRASDNLAGLYRAHLFAEQFAAEQIARHFQSGSGGKLLAFLREAELEPGRGVPFFVRQKVQLRQLVFGPEDGAAGPKLLTDSRQSGSILEIVDRAPGATRDQAGLAFPRTCAVRVLGPLFIAPE